MLSTLKTNNINGTKSPKPNKSRIVLTKDRKITKINFVLVEISRKCQILEITFNKKIFLDFNIV